MGQLPDNEVIKELRDELKYLSKTIRRSNKETSRFTKVLMIFALIQIMIGIGQALLMVSDSGYQSGAMVIYLLLLVLILYVFKSSDNIFKKESDK